MRLDKYIAEHHSLTRNRAAQLISAGLVSLNGQVVYRSSIDISDNANICISEDKRIHWVSRSAMKLDSFLSGTGKTIIVRWSECLDVGASTGGFTQVLLEHGARHVDAVDVWTAQLHPSLHGDTRVMSYEQTDIREFTNCRVTSRNQEPKVKNHSETTSIQSRASSYDIIVCDASFISLHDIINSILSLADDHTNIILLFKPQFEVGKSNLRKTWVPKSDVIIEDSKKRFEQRLHENEVRILACEKSALIGEAGNQEWLYWIQKNPQGD
jgi:23S rRNA (cytidine1920-2'-O)/16S rRNA (cytidine1409-2'-O)-methyltransferase